MGDRSTLYLNYAACDKKAVERKLGEPSYSDPVEDGIISAQFDEVNWGGQTELDAISKAGVPYWGKCEAGAGYAAVQLAGIGHIGYEFDAGFGSVDSLCVEFSLETGRMTGMLDAEKFRKRWLRAKTAVAKRAKTKGLKS